MGTKLHTVALRKSHILLQIRAKGFSMALLFHTDAQREKGVKKKKKKRIRERGRECVVHAVNPFTLYRPATLETRQGLEKAH